jgi:DNA-directed RNA polymerase specialized sigma24 family protein
MARPRETTAAARALDGERLRRVSAMVSQHDAQLHRVVRRRGSPSAEIVDDACAYAWIQLLAAEHVDLRPPLWEALAWLTSCAVRHARMLDAVQRHLAAGAETPVTAGRA